MYDVRNEIVDNYAYFCGVCAYLEEINVKLAHRHLRECTIRVEDAFFVICVLRCLGKCTMLSFGVNFGGGSE